MASRLLALELRQGDIKLAQLTACQNDAARGRYASAMSAFVEWVAPRYEELQKRLDECVIDLRSEVGAMDHARTSAIVADLIAGLELFFEFAVAEGAFTCAEGDESLKEMRAAIISAAAAQKALRVSENPATRFIELLRSALSSGTAHVTTPSGDPPEHRPCGAGVATKCCA